MRLAGARADGECPNAETGDPAQIKQVGADITTGDSAVALGSDPT